jgi:hypothetical protein
MARVKTTFITLNQGIDTRPLLQASIGSARDIVNFFVHEKGLTKRPGIRLMETLSRTGEYIDSHLLTVEGHDCMADIFWNNGIVAHVRSLESDAVNLTLQATVARTTKPAWAKVLYLNNNQFMIVCEGARLVPVRAEASYDPPANWLAFETRYLTDSLDTLQATSGDYVSISFALEGTPYVIRWRHTFADNEAFYNVFNKFNADMMGWLNELFSRLYSASGYTWQTINYDTNKVSMVLHEPWVNGFNPNYTSANGTLTLNGVIDIGTTIGNTIASYNGTIDYSITPEGGSFKLTLGSTTISGITGIGLYSASMSLANLADKIKLIFKRVTNEEELPYGTAGFTVELIDSAGRLKTYVVDRPGVVRPTPIYRTKLFEYNGANFVIKRETAPSGIKFVNIAAGSVSSLTGTYAINDGYTMLLNDDVNIAEYLVMPSVLGKSLSDVTSYQGRVVYCGGQAVTFSKTDEPFEVVARDPMNVVATDPVDLVFETDIYYVMPYDRYLMVFGANEQYVISWDNYFAPDTVAVTPVTSYSIARTRPALIGNSLLFLTAQGKLMEFYVREANALPIAIAISQETLPTGFNRLVPVPSMPAGLVFNSDGTEAYYIYMPPIGETLYRPISKWQFAVGATPVGEANQKLYFARYYNATLYVGTIDLEMLKRIIINDLEEYEFLALDWAQEATSITPSCPTTYGNDAHMLWTAEFPTNWLDASLPSVFFAYRDYYNRLDEATDIISQTNLTVQFRDPLYLCIDTGASYVLDNDVVADYGVDTVYRGYKVQAKVRFQVPPLNGSDIIPTKRYSVSAIEPLAFGGEYIVNFYKRPDDTTPYAVRKVVGQVIGLDRFNYVTYRDDLARIRQPLNGGGVIEFSQEVLEPWILFGYSAVIDVTERGF